MPWQIDQRLFKKSIQQGSTAAQKLFRATNTISALEGLAIYQDALDIRLAGFLSADFPVIRRLLGSRFYSIARAYRMAHPSRYASGTDFGRSFPEFLRGLKWLGEESAAADLALLEWKLLELVYAAEIPSSGLEKISTAREVDWQAARLLFDPSHRFISSDYPLEKIYEEEAWSAGNGVDLLLWRQDGEACYRNITIEEKKLLQALSAGLRLGDVEIEKMSFGPSLFADWIESGLVRGIRWAS